LQRAAPHNDLFDNVAAALSADDHGVHRGGEGNAEGYCVEWAAVETGKRGFSSE
jgi:hypothetical protein